MNKKIHLLINTLPISFILLILTGCSSDNTTGIDNSANNSDDKDKMTLNQTIAEKKLSITEHKCSGCGKCVLADPEHFIFNNTVRKALVISTENLDSKNLTIAISICRDQAIELI